MDTLQCRARAQAESQAEAEAQAQAQAQAQAETPWRTHGPRASNPASRSIGRESAQSHRQRSVP
ncbi:hypothetical protein CIK73_16435 [Brachybacterium alimentarium]|nr:hypothetical protein CIK73_16435 [Brachybacterium alimentarium]RCS74906.1 hypothetical protein CIK70_17610 [Brachybacterium alimentarium]RCS83164.1 hypothetical protein CIK67_13325 [Brachybacterium alimentarium]RCS85343.1 hypothetical protein CIK69_16715 [Brachybacterium alimentarium]